MKLTEFMSAEIKPIRKGWYQARFNKNEGNFWMYWDGRVWQRICGFTDDSAHVQRPSTRQPRFDSCFGCHPIYRYEAWRGLAEEPK